MPSDVVSKGDIVTITITFINETGGLEDISAATTRTIYLKSSTGLITALSASFVTDGTDAKIQASTAATTLTDLGTWEVQGYVTDGSTIRLHTRQEKFDVDDTFGP